MIRGYLNNSIDPVARFPETEHLFPQNAELIGKIKDELQFLMQELDKHKEWEFKDPLESDINEEVSLFNLRGLYKHLETLNRVN